MTTKHYHGWIYRSQEKGYNETFSVQYKNSQGGSTTHFMGYAAEGAALAVQFFEEAKVIKGDGTTLVGRNLGQITLEQTPIGLRVFTEEPNEDVLRCEVCGIDTNLSCSTHKDRTVYGGCVCPRCAVECVREATERGYNALPDAAEDARTSMANRRKYTVAEILEAAELRLHECAAYELSAQVNAVRTAVRNYDAVAMDLQVWP